MDGSSRYLGMTFLLPCLTILITDTNWIQRLQLQLSVLIYFPTREIDVQPWTITRNELYRVYPFRTIVMTEYQLNTSYDYSCNYPQSIFQLIKSMSNPDRARQNIYSLLLHVILLSNWLSAYQLSSFKQQSCLK